MPSYYTAGSGGAGPTIVSATFLLLASQAITIADHLIVPRARSDCRIVDFGGRIGGALVSFDNPDVPHSEALGLANCTSRFGTRQILEQLWLDQALPSTWLNNARMQKFAVLSMPVTMG